MGEGVLEKGKGGGRRGDVRTRTHTNRTPAHIGMTRQEDEEGVGEGEGEEEEGTAKQSHMEDKWQECWQQARPALPGITEIVFKARNTLNVRRAETLPRFINSVIYLRDQTHRLLHSIAQAENPSTQNSKEPTTKAS